MYIHIYIYGQWIILIIFSASTLINSNYTNSNGYKSRRIKRQVKPLKVSEKIVKINKKQTKCHNKNLHLLTS